jgi:hypothetical protein
VKFTPEELFGQVLGEDKAEISERVLHGLNGSYKIEFRGARCMLRWPRPAADYATREEFAFGVKSRVFQWIYATDNGGRIPQRRSKYSEQIAFLLLHERIKLLR